MRLLVLEGVDLFLAVPFFPGLSGEGLEVLPPLRPPTAITTTSSPSHHLRHHFLQPLGLLLVRAAEWSATRTHVRIEVGRFVRTHASFDARVHVSSTYQEICQNARQMWRQDTCQNTCKGGCQHTFLGARF